MKKQLDSSPLLLNDLYQFSMAYGYWAEEMDTHEAVFHLYFRKNPFGGGYAVAAGLGDFLEALKDYRFTESDLEYLAELKGNDGKPLFRDNYRGSFINYLRDFRFTCDIHAVEEGTIVFPNEPLIRVKGPLIECQLLETVLLNIINYQTLIATKAARICYAAQADTVLEFGARRAQADGALAGSRAAYIGGCDATSNVLAGKLYGIPVKGTHAHSWIMSFENEQCAMDSYAHVMSNNCVILVDTYDTLEGVRKAINVGRHLEEKGYKLAGIRLDSGDLTTLSIEARKMLDEAGYEHTKIVASNDLDEYEIEKLKKDGAKIDVWGVGTNLITGGDQSALGGVYKMAAIREPNTDGTMTEWRDTIKLSNQEIKVSNPGFLQVKRYAGEFMMADVIIDERDIHPLVALGIQIKDAYELLLKPVIRRGKVCYNSPTLENIRDRTIKNLALLHPTVKTFNNPHVYPVNLDNNLYEKKKKMIASYKK